MLSVVSLDDLRFIVAVISWIPPCVYFVTWSEIACVYKQFNINFLYAQLDLPDWLDPLFFTVRSSFASNSMAMYPNATHGYMPFVKPAHKRQAAKKTKVDKADTLKSKSGDMKTYKVTLKDRSGFTYTYIIQANTATNSTPILCESRVAAPKSLSSSLPNMKSPSMASPESRRHSSCLGLAQAQDDLTKVEDGQKKGIFNSIINFIKRRTSSKTATAKQTATNTKSKRKPKPVFPKKRQRTISAMSNLDPIQESPEEDEDDNSDTDSYSHDSVSCDGSVTESWWEASGVWMSV